MLEIPKNTKNTDAQRMISPPIGGNNRKQTPFEIVTDGRCLVITGVRKQAEERKFQQALDRVHKRFGRAMRKLAE